MKKSIKSCGIYFIMANVVLLFYIFISKNLFEVFRITTEKKKPISPPYYSIYYYCIGFIYACAPSLRAIIVISRPFNELVALK